MENIQLMLKLFQRIWIYKILITRKLRVGIGRIPRPWQAVFAPIVSSKTSVNLKGLL